MSLLSFLFGRKTEPLLDTHVGEYRASKKVAPRDPTLPVKEESSTPVVSGRHCDPNLSIGGVVGGYAQMQIEMPGGWDNTLCVTGSWTPTAPQSGFRCTSGEYLQYDAPTGQFINPSGVAIRPELLAKLSPHEQAQLYDFFHLQRPRSQHVFYSG